MPGQQHHPQCWTVAAHAFAICAAMAGCAIIGGDAQTCVSWVEFESPADAMANAEVVVLAAGPTASAGTTDLFGVDANVHSVQIAEVLKGTAVRAGENLEVISTPVTCTGGDAYPDGDPLGASGTLVLFLSQDADAHVWRTVTPSQGVVAATADGDAPLTWPTP